MLEAKIIKLIGSRGGKVICECLSCGKEFEEFKSKIKDGGGKFCSWECYQKEHEPWNKGLVGIFSGENAWAWKGGLPNCLECGKKLSIRHGKYQYCKHCVGKSPDHIKNLSQSHIGINTGEKHPLWKGDSATYRVIHRWVERVMGKARECHDCGKTEGRIHWANKDHKYKRVEEDWISLCPKCHFTYDKLKKLRHKEK